MNYRWVAPGERIPLEVAAAFLRLGNKYEIETLRTEALKRLYFEFPSNLAGLDTVIYGDGKGTMIERAGWMYIDAANLAREQNLLSALPIALYWCCRWKLSVLEQGQRRPDGTISTLSPVNERACFLAYSELLELKEQKTFLWALPTSPGFDSCRSPNECRAARNKLAASVLFPTSATLCFGIWKDEYKTGQCNLCIPVARRMHKDGRQQLWDALPGVFGLPDWEELRKERGTLLPWVELCLIRNADRCTYRCSVMGPRVAFVYNVILETGCARYGRVC